jgi:hypothetical protein
MLGIDPSEPFPERPSGFFVSLGGHQRLFKVQPSLRITRLIVVTETTTGLS